MSFSKLVKSLIENNGGKRKGHRQQTTRVSHGWRHHQNDLNIDLKA
jgi:hypothetical protein